MTALRSARSSPDPPFNGESPRPRRSEPAILTFILVAFILLGLTYALVTPVFEASDELWHYPMIRHLADGNPLPVQVTDPALAGPWNQEASQPPLYYYLAAALTFWIDTGDMDQVRWLNPHVDNGVITADGNINLVVHDPVLNPARGTLLAVRIIRIFSVFLGLATVYLTYLLGRETVPDRPLVALGAAATVAFTPMFLFISGAVNNDNLVVPLTSLALLLMIRLVRAGRAGHPPRPPAVIALGLVLGLGALTKFTAIGLLPLALGSLFLAYWAVEDRRGSDLRSLLPALGRALMAFALLMLPVLLIAGWWYLRNIQLYGDWTGWNAFIAVLGQRAHPASLAQLWDERWGFMLSYWGLFGGVNVPMAERIYHLLNVVALLGAAGFVIYLVKLAGQELPVSANESSGPPAGGPLTRLAIRILRLAVSHFPLLLMLLWILAVVVGLIRWATVTWSSQGRLVFSAISALNILLVIGLAGWLPRRPGRWLVIALATFMLVISAAAPWLWIRPAYLPPNHPAPEGTRPVAVNFDDQMQLEGYYLAQTEARPGDSVDVYLVWRALAAMDRDWSVFVHLNDPVLELPAAQRDMYPGQGLLATRLLSPGQQVVNHYRIAIPPTTAAPTELELTVGLYDYATERRLPAGGPQVGPSGDAAVLATLAIEPAPGELPNPVNVNFEDRLILAGYSVEPRRLPAGDVIELVLYWRANRPLATDYTIFAQVVGPDTTRWADQDLPQATTTWPAGEERLVPMVLTLDPATPAGVYPIIIGVYSRPADGSFDRLQIVTPEGRLTDDFLILTNVRVD
jgi:4-amino-4-deoxy-L-arabinose transferase-like glycosyltransferase